MAINVHFKVVRLFPIQTVRVKIKNQKAGYHNRHQDLQILSM